MVVLCFQPLQLLQKRGKLCRKTREMMPKNESTCAEKRENDAENERKRMAYEKTEMLYFKVKIGSISLEKHTHP